MAKFFQQTGDLKRLLTTREVAERLGYSLRSLQAKAARGDIPGAIRIFGHWRFDPDALEIFITEKGSLQCRSISATKYIGLGSAVTVECIDTLYERAIKKKRRKKPTHC